MIQVPWQVFAVMLLVVVTTFGRPSGTLSNGLHVKAPWQSVTAMNGTIQIDNHTGDAATTVRLGNNSTAFVDNSVRWRIQPAAAEKLRKKVGGQIEIINVIVPLVNYDPATQDRINALSVEKANTRVAEQRAKTAAAEARANEILAASVTDDPQRSGQQVPGRRAGGANQPARLLAEHHGGANCGGAVTFGVFRYACGDLCGTILVCALSGPLAVR